MWKIAQELKKAGVVGINARNAGYIMPLNQRKFYPLVDDKRQTKELAMKAGLEIPELYAVIEYQWQIKTGITTTAVQHDKVVELHPDTNLPVSNLQIPNWDKILYISALSAELSHLGYLGVDIVLDENLGPLILELNARPGLAIQIANRMGFTNRFNQIDLALPNLKTLEEKIAFVDQL